MRKFNNPLENVRIASPCSADWEQMFGDERKRFCGDCKLNVYNLSAMSRTEAENFLTAAEGRVCVRYFARTDGTVITQDCPVGWEKFKRRTRRMATAMASLIATLLAGLFAVSVFSRRTNAVVGEMIPYATPTPRPRTTPTPPPLMGAIRPNTDHSDRPTMGKISVRGKESN
ncbi:MAG TPA: hypothetical protein PLR83_10045 [Pyrinomonadaceae bacterium]|nr:hypothetical protein [Pyrinomonadaceae bacterium]